MFYDLMPYSLLGTKLIIPFRWPGIITQLGYLILVKILNVTWKDASMIIHWKSKFLSDVWLLETPWTIQSMEFSRPEYPSILQGSSQPRDQTQVSNIAGGFLTSWSTKEAEEYWNGKPIPSPVDLPNPGIEPGSPALQVDSYQLS